MSLENGDGVIVGRRRELGWIIDRKPGFYLVAFPRDRGVTVESWYAEDYVKPAAMRMRWPTRLAFWLARLLRG